MSNDPDETDLLDLGLARLRLRERLEADGVFCRADQAALAAMEGPHERMGHRLRVRRSMETLLACGLTRRSGARAREAGLTVVIGEETRQVLRIVATDTVEPREAA